MSAVIAVIWGSSFLWIAIAIEHVDVAVVPLARCTFGALALVAFPGSRVRLERGDYARFVALGFCGWPCHSCCTQSPSKQSTPRSPACSTVVCPIVTTAVTACAPDRLPSAFRMVAVFVGGAGIALISLSSVGENNSADVQGIVLLSLALISYAISANVARPMQSKYGALEHDVVDRRSLARCGRCHSV